MGKLIFKQINSNNEVEEIYHAVVYRFRIGDVEDPDLYASQPMWEWQNSDQGKFIMKNAIAPPEWHRHLSSMTCEYDYVVTAKLEKKKLSEFYLKWGKIQ